jgi:proteasome accessory factor A
VRRGLAAHLISPETIAEAVTVPPQSTRARLRGDFVRRAAEAGRDFTVDWGQLKLNDIPPQVVVCSDPFASVDERVERLINAL